MITLRVIKGFGCYFAEIFRMKIYRIAQGSEHNLSPFQHSMPKHVRRMAYDRLPETCNKVREILDEAKFDIMNGLGIAAEDEAEIDLPISRAFQRIRDEVTQVFRDEQMRLINGSFKAPNENI